jgi:hypothetical protein
MTAPRELVFPNPVEDERDFFDRTDPVEKVRTALARRTVVVQGGRLIGKTSLLNVVAHWAETQGPYAVISLPPVDSCHRLMTEIVHGVRDWVASNAAPADPGFRGRFTSTTVTGLINTLQDLSRHAYGMRFLLCVDEFDSLLQGCPEPEARKILDLVVHLASQPRLPVRFLFTILRIPEQIRLSYRSPLMNQSTIVLLRPWSDVESRQFVDWLLGGESSLDDAAHRELYAAAGGHPYFTKAVLDALLSQPAAVPPEQNAAAPPAQPAQAVRSAARAAAASPEVNAALSNIVTAHLPGQAVAVLDRAAANPAGLTARDLHDLAVSDSLLQALLDDGFLAQQRQRFQLRLGLWRYWREAHPWGARPPGWLARLGAAVIVVVLSRRTRVTLYSSFAVLLLAFAFGTALVLPTDTFTAAACAGPASGLLIRVSYPSYVSSGDEQMLQIRVVNRGAGDSAAGSVVVSFPDDPYSVSSDNGIEFGPIHPGEQRTRQVAFTTSRIRRLFSPAGADITAQLTINVVDASCPPQRWAMAVAPIPHLHVIQRISFGLVLAVLVPVLIETAFLRRHARLRSAGEHPPAPSRAGGG